MIITTAGVDLTYPCYVTEYAYCKKVLDPGTDVENDEYLIDICELDPEDYADISNIGDERLWWKANPIRMSYPEGVEKLRGEYAIAKEQTEHMTAFLTKCLNVWVPAKPNGYMDMEKWKACEIDQHAVPDTTGWPVYVGFDMSAKIDLTSVAFVLPYESAVRDIDGNPVVRYLVYSHSFIPSAEKLAERKAVDKVPYDDWERRGFLTVTDTPIVDQGAVMQYVLTLCRRKGWEIQCLCFDPAKQNWRAA